MTSNEQATITELQQQLVLARAAAEVLALRVSGIAAEIVSRYRRHKDDDTMEMHMMCEGYLQALNLLTDTPVAQLRVTLGYTDEQAQEILDTVEAHRRTARLN